MKTTNRIKPSCTVSVHIPFDGVWGSEEDNKAFTRAETVFKERALKYPYVALIRSRHPYSPGYWIETVRKKVDYPDLIIKTNHD